MGELFLSGWLSHLSFGILVWVVSSTSQILRVLGLW
jgi:hypothetical protein